MKIRASHLVFLAVCALSLFVIASWEKTRRCPLDDLEDNTDTINQPIRDSEFTSACQSRHVMDSLKKSLETYQAKSFTELFMLIIELLLLLAKYVVRSLRKIAIGARVAPIFITSFYYRQEDSKENICALVYDCDFFKRLAKFKKLSVVLLSCFAVFWLLKLLYRNIVKHGIFAKLSYTLAFLSVTYLLREVLFY